MSKSVSVIGSGSWGTALAAVLAAEGAPTTIWARRAEVADDINKNHMNSSCLPGVKLPAGLKATQNIADTLTADIVLLVTPAQSVRAMMKELKTHLKKGQAIVVCAKGMETGTGLMMSQVAKEEAPDATIAILTGPTFADEIVRGLPSAFTLAADDLKTAQDIAAALARKTLRPYASDDLIGAQIGGAVKNVIAIACGIIMGKGLGESARAALVTRGLAEIARLSAARGGKRETLMGMCGVGDMMLTCSSMKSRNYSLGFELGQGKSLADILVPRKGVTEGVHTARAVMVMAKQYNIDMPISHAVDLCLNENVSVERAIGALLERPLKAEHA